MNAFAEYIRAGYNDEPFDTHDTLANDCSLTLLGLSDDDDCTTNSNENSVTQFNSNTSNRGSHVSDST